VSRYMLDCDNIKALPSLGASSLESIRSSSLTCHSPLAFPIHYRFRSKTMPAMKLAVSVLTIACLAASVLAAPAGTSSASAPGSSPTAPYASENSNNILWSENQNIFPQPIRGPLGATILGPQNLATDLQNADLLAPPSTDSGTVYVLYCYL
jgi:hypothetical protein